MKRVSTLGAIALSVAVVAARLLAQTPSDAVLAGYQLRFDGQKAESARHFAELLKTQPDNLPARYGWLSVQNERMGGNTAMQQTFEKALDDFIDVASARYARSKQDSEALLYLAQGHFLRAAYKFEHDKGMFGAARDGSKSKGYVDAYIRQHPENDDAYFVLGLYNYYVDIAPSFVKVLRVFLFLPAGNRVEGLKQLERAAAKGVLNGTSAQMALIDIYSSLENRPADAIAIGERIRQLHPANDDVDFALANVYAGASMEDPAQAAMAYQRIIDHRRVDTSFEGSTARYRALLGLANTRQNQWRLEDAIATLAPPIDAGVTNPDWVFPQFLLRRANYRGLLNDPGAADDIKRVQSNPKTPASQQTDAANLMKWLEARQASGEGAIFAALLPGNRLTSEAKWEEARRALDAVRLKYPQSALVAYRLAYLDFARGESERALPALMTIAANKTATESVRANALLYAARAHDLAGRREDARKMYQKVIDDFEKQGVAGRARVGLITPYKRPGKV